MKTAYTTFSLLLSALILQTFNATSQTVSTFENLSLSENSYWNGSDLSGGFQDGEAYFYNQYNTEWSYWAGGFAYSNTTDKITPGPSNMYSAYTGGGFDGSSNYAVANGSSIGIKLTGAEAGKLVRGLYMTNTTYTALSMKEGDAFAKKFGGSTGTDPDWYKVTITGYRNGTASRNSVDVYLADYRFEDNARDYIVDYWKWIDLTPLGHVDSVAFIQSSSDVGEWGMNTPAYFAIDNFNELKFESSAGTYETSAMHKDNSAFIAWATAATIDRGPQDISNGTSPDATAGDHSMATGAAGNGIVSLGDGGTATLTFANPLANGDGYDFAVFENGIESEGLAFLELAFVEVSSDGNRFVRFPAVSFIDASVQTESYGLSDGGKVHNLAGKYIASYGTPFDLEELKDSAGLDVNNITHVRIVDVVGSINTSYSTYDSYGNIINDPWPTAFGSGGFDLDAVGVIHTVTSTGVAYGYNSESLKVYPNPAVKGNQLVIKADDPNDDELTVHIYDQAGQMVKEFYSNDNHIKVSSADMLPGIYVVKVIAENKVMTKKLIIH